MSLQQTLISEGYSPLRICQALRKVVIAALKEDLPEGFYPYQIQVSDRIITITLQAVGEELIILQARQSGKTEAIVVSLIVLSIYFAKMLKRHLRIGIFAPAGSQAILVFKERLRRRCSRIKPLLESLGLRLLTGDSIYSELFIIRNTADIVDARTRCLSIGEKSNITSETFNLIIIEQCEDVDPLKMTQEVFPMLAAVGGARVLSGTSKDRVVNTYFYDAVTKREDRSNIISVDWREAAKYNKKYLAYVSGEKEQLGPDSIAFLTQYELRWILGVDKFTTLEQMRDLSRKFPLVLPTVDGKPIFNLYAGWDVAKEMDRSVATWGYGEGDRAHVTEWMEFEGTDYADQSELIAQRCVDLGTTQICIDTAGPGDPVMDIFKRELRKIEGGVKVKAKGIKTNNIREEDITSKLMMDLWKKGLVDYPSQEEAIARNNRRERARFIEEFLDLNKIWKGNMLRLEHPKGYGKHDDYPKSCGLLLRSILKPPVKLAIRILEY